MRASWAIFLVFGLAAAPADAAERPSPAQLVSFFNDVVFGAEYTNGGSTEIKKWHDPIRISVSALSGKMIDKPGGGKELKLANDRPTSAQIGMIRKHLGTLLKLTGATSESAKKVGKEPNFFIKFVPRLAMHAPFLVRGADAGLLKKLAQPGVCYFLTAAKRGKIIWATIVANNALEPAAMDVCLLEEMTQAFGLPNDSDIVKPSVFNNRATPRSLNRNDEILIRTLYDPRLPAGFPVKKAGARIERIIGELNEKLP